MIFDIEPNSEILFGEGASLRTGKRVQELGCKKVLCITDVGIKKVGILDKIVENLENAGLKVVKFTGVLPDPPDYRIEECAEIAREEEVDGVIGLGGGSSMDTAKCVNILLSNPSPITQYFGPGEGLKKETPLILIPTTAGTGSEVSIVAVVTNTENHRKGGCIGPQWMADLAIVDPELTLGLPPGITAFTGMDAFSHAAEAITSGQANPMGELQAKEAISLITKSLPVAVEDGSNLEARKDLSLAATLAGIAGIKDSMVHFGHSLAHTIGSLYHDIPHGIACALVIPEVIRNDAKAVPEKVKVIGKAMGLKFDDDLSPEEIGDRVGDTIKALNKRVGIPTAREAGIKKSDLGKIAEIAYQDETAIFAPLKLSYSDALEIMERIYEG